ALLGFLQRFLGHDGTAENEADDNECHPAEDGRPWVSSTPAAHPICEGARGLHLVPSSGCAGGVHRQAKRPAPAARAVGGAQVSRPRRTRAADYGAAPETAGQAAPAEETSSSGSAGCLRR